ncbi:hypothetical protein [Yoonia sp. 2307UL14-13]|uniref:hypothetical protein n=1 Tax=Yoonia sp. 2307UL14-13 TaxID=3126506 RepID=UPI00309D4A27
MRVKVLFAILLSGCTSIVPMTAMRLSGLSPTTADPADFAVDLTLPAGIDVSPGAARLLFSTTRTDTDETASGAFALLRDGSVFRVDPADHDALRALQATARDWDAENPDATEGSMLINVAPCRVGAGPAADATVSVAIQMEQDGAFLPLVRNGPLSAVASEEQLREMPDCP